MLLSLSFIALLASHLSYSYRLYDTHNYYVVEHDPSVASLADIAVLLGVQVEHQVGELKNHWLVSSEKGLESRGVHGDRVLDTFHAMRQEPRLSARSEAHEIISSVRSLDIQTPRQRVKRAPIPLESSARAVADRLGIQDPLFSEQWHLVNDEFPEHMMNVTGLWELGITGKGVISSLVDDGLDYTSEDLKANFDADDSYDFNDHVSLPTPKLSDDHHGTRCAGQIGAGKNSVCGMGIAYDSKIAGVRILSGPITDVDEAAALNYGYQNVSIYSCSWGPPDNGKAMEGPSTLIKKAVLNGINKGRGGKGSIFVFASGNGAARGDQCNFDGYTNSIYSVTVSAVDHKGLHPYYSEPCAANMIVAYSSGSGKQIVTTDKGENACAKTHGGTSAAAPNAVGVFALALEVRPELTWRDIQYLCIKTARQINPDDEDWETTAAGRPYSYKYGFGALDGYNYVMAAKDWTLVKPQAWFKSQTVQLENGTMNEDGSYSGGQFIPEGGVSNAITVTQDMLDNNNFEALEHINIKVWIDHAKRGDVEVEVVSPHGVKSVLASQRKDDRDSSGYPGWIFMSVKHWGEDPVGDWTIRVSDMNDEGSTGRFLGWNMMFWGSTIDASKAVEYEMPPNDLIFPPHDNSPAEDVPTTTKQHSKPTAFLSSDVPTPTNQEAEVSVTPTSSASPSSTPTADEGWFAGLSKLSANPKWFYGAIAAVVIFALAVGAFFFWRRRRAQLRNYTTLSQGSDDVSMSGVGRGAIASRPRGTRELYDAFGEVSDDEEEINEQTRLHSSDPRYPESEGLAFHSAFLDDDPDTALSEEYRDIPLRSASPRLPTSGSSSSTIQPPHTA